MSDGAAEIPVFQGLSASCAAGIQGGDTLGLWRLRKSLSLQDARWYLAHGRIVEASHCVGGARYAHREIVKIKRVLAAQKARR